MVEHIPLGIAPELIGTIGARMYKNRDEAIIREYVSNAWDADAEHLYITTGDTIVFKDDGNGMGYEEVKRFWTTGNTHKRTAKCSKEFKRKLIGQFGIGKFSALGLAKEITMITMQNGFKATTVFNLSKFLKGGFKNAITLTRRAKLDEDGVTVILSKMENGGIKTETAIKTIRKLFSEQITTPNFRIYIDTKRIEQEEIAGRKHKVNISKGELKINGESELPPAIAGSFLLQQSSLREPKLVPVAAQSP